MANLNVVSKGVSCVVNTAVADPTTAVFIGVAKAYDFCFDGTNWIAFAATLAGTVLPLQVKGCRVTAGGAAPTAGDIVFLY